jgi:hypothetical protein
VKQTFAKGKLFHVKRAIATKANVSRETRLVGAPYKKPTQQRGRAGGWCFVSRETGGVQCGRQDVVSRETRKKPHSSGL